MHYLGTTLRRAVVATLLTLAMITGLSAFGAGTATAAPTTSEREVVGQSDFGKINSKV